MVTLSAIFASIAAITLFYVLWGPEGDKRNYAAAVVLFCIYASPICLLI